VKKVLFVCTGNTCRSAMAQAIFDTLAENEGLPFRAESVGTEALEGKA
jgi:protein-tyrosine phosphatase